MEVRWISGHYEFQAPLTSIPKTYYVNPLAKGNGDGTSWVNAYTSLWPAINNTCADTIKVAAGTYKPAISSRDSSFAIKYGQTYLGGYPNTGSPSDADRNPALNPTILSGNIGSLSDSADNSTHVVSMYDVFGQVTLDGFVIRDGYAKYYFTPNGSQTSFSGAGIIIFRTHVAIINCTIKNNFASFDGGGMASYARSLKIVKTLIENNRVEGAGGGLYINTGGEGKTIVENSVITGNSTTSAGGGCYADGSPGIEFSNTVFYGNYSVKSGAGLYNASSRVWITNCDFVNNSCSPYGRGAGLANQTASIYPIVKNCIFQGNTFGGGDYYLGSDIFDADCSNYDCYKTNVSYTRLQIYYSAGVSNIDADPLFINIGDPDGADNIWMTADDGLRLQACSPVIDKGSNIADSAITMDITGANRILNATVDLGPYEFNGSPNGSPVLNNANDSLIANREYTTPDGWTHYYKDCTYLFSIKKNGQNIGSVGNPNFEVKLVTTPAYGTGTATNLSAAAYNTSSSWFAMNKYWNIKSVNPVKDSILVRFPYSIKDFNDLKGSNPLLTSHQQIEFFKVSNTNNPFDLSVPASNFVKYANGPSPSLTKWAFSQTDSVFLCDYYVRGFSGGSGGSSFNGPLADLAINSQIVSPVNIFTNTAFSVTFTESNSGTNVAAPHKINFYLSADNVLTPGANGDILLGEYSVTNPLAAGTNTGAIIRQLFMPCSVVPRNYFLLFQADATNIIAESLENNNVSNSAIVVAGGNNMPGTPVIAVTPGNTVCSPVNVSLSANSAGCNSCTYTWNNGRTGQVIVVNSSATYTVTVNNGCFTASSSQPVTINPLPVISVSSTGPNPICQGSVVTLTATGASNYVWTGPGLNATTGSVVTAIPQTAGYVYYAVTGTTNGCSRSDSTKVTVYANPIVNIIQNDTTICTGSSIPLDAVSNGWSNIWTPATGLNANYQVNVIATPASTTTYRVTTNSIFGCRNYDSVKVTVSSVVMPSVVVTYSGCPSNTLTFRAVPNNQGSNPQYQWYVNNVLTVGTGNSLVLNNAVNNMQVYVKMIASATCANPLTVSSAPVVVNCTITAVPVISDLESFQVSPNPASNFLVIKMKLNQLKSLVFTFADAAGKIVYQSLPKKISGTYVTQIGLERLGSGIYYLKTTLGKESFIEKIVIIK